MTLPKAALDFLNSKADDANVPRPMADDDLYKIGVLNSIEVVELVALLEESCGIGIPDEDVNDRNFQSINSIERYLESLKSEHG